MENYYDDILQEIDDLLQNGKVQEADLLVQRELKMPYIPKEAEDQLRKAANEIRYRKAEHGEHGEESMEKLLHRLKGKPQSQLLAAEKLAGRNLRECLDEIKDWLEKDPQPEASALMIEALAEQEINDEFVMIRNGVEYTFFPEDVVPIAKQEVLPIALHYLQDWFYKDPDLYEMAQTLLIHEMYMFLPLMYEKEEAPSLAYEIALQVCDLMNDDMLHQKIEGLYRSIVHAQV